VPKGRQRLHRHAGLKACRDESLARNGGWYAELESGTASIASAPVTLARAKWPFVFQEVESVVDALEHARCSVRERNGNWGRKVDFCQHRYPPSKSYPGTNRYR
jgi:hypothetical protein